MALFIRQQTSLINAIRAHCAEFVIVAPVGRRGVGELLNVVADENRVPEIARACLLALGAQLRRIKEQILEFDRMITAWHRCCETSRLLDLSHKADISAVLNDVRFRGQSGHWSGVLILNLRASENRQPTKIGN